MVRIEKLSTNNWDELVELHNEGQSKHLYDKSFLDYYVRQNFLTKALLKKFVKLIKYNNNYIGYLWHEAPLDINIRVWAFYIKKDPLKYVDENTLKQFDNSILTYEAIETNDTIVMLQKVGFREVRPTALMKLDVNNYYKSINFTELDQQSKKLNISFKLFIEDQDEELRCSIQNQIFSSNDRDDLSIEDIANDITQDYYLKDMSLFILLDNKTIGYGQIIKTRSFYTLVNYGVIPEYRGKGIGKLLLNKLIELCRSNYIYNLSLRVDKDNTHAIDVYNWAGFEKEFIISSWDR